MNNEQKIRLTVCPIYLDPKYFHLKIIFKPFPRLILILSEIVLKACK